MILNRKTFAFGTALLALVQLGSVASAQQAVDTVPEIAAMLPEANRERGVLRFGASSTNMPAQYTTEDGELVGVAVEMYKGAAQVLGVEPVFDIVTFDALQPGIDSGRYDVVTMGDSVERHKIVDILSIFYNGFGLLATGNFVGGTDLDYKTDLCGHSVAVTKGTLVERNLTKMSEENCVGLGKDPVKISSYVDNSGVALAVISEQDEIGMLELVVAHAYVARNPDRIKLVGSDRFASSGAAIKKGNDQLRDAFHRAMLHLDEIGYYDQVLEKYGISDMKVSGMTLNLSSQN